MTDVDGVMRSVEQLERSTLDLTSAIREQAKAQAETDKAASLERERIRSRIKTVEVRVTAIEGTAGLQAGPVTVPNPSGALRKLPLPLEEESKARTKLWLALAALVGGIATLVGGLAAQAAGILGQ